MFQLFAYREANRVVDPNLIDEEFMTGWISNAQSRGWSNENARVVQETANAFGALL